ncbi:MAG: STAS domain-containing protein [Bryobacteraceae bacterium]|nr:STAS domain-containing protein [Bryobacteraceae bacterium]
MARLQLEGAVVLGSRQFQALRGLRRLVSGVARIEIDLSGVEKIDAAGIGAIASLFKAAREQDAAFRVLNPRYRLANQFVVCGLAGTLLDSSHTSRTSRSRSSNSS